MSLLDFSPRIPLGTFSILLERKHQSNNVIKELINSNNKHIHRNNDILGEMCKFYEDLYILKSVDNNDIDSYLQTLHLE